MKYSSEVKNSAIKLRRKGYSINEISSMLRLSKSTVSVWCSKVILSDKANNRIAERKRIGKENFLKSILRKKELFHKNADIMAKLTLSSVVMNKELYKILCSIFFWTEGGRHSDSYLYFINSDPKMIKLFLKLLRESFRIDESKLRALIHIHEYHDPVEIRTFWSKITNIPLSQFSKNYQKPHTGKRKRESYNGSIRIRYYDHKVALELRSIYNMLYETI